jgi:DNA-binding response OmpR family regulator
MKAMRVRRILVVDDDAAVRRLIERTLVAEGYEVVTVEDDRQGLTAAGIAKVGFDLVVTSTFLPNVSGTDLVRELQTLYSGLPILHLNELACPVPTVQHRSLGRRGPQLIERPCR